MIKSGYELSSSGGGDDLRMVIALDACNILM